jgi:hypothetical protein
MYSNYRVRTGLVNFLKNNSAIIGLVSDEIRERQYQGTDFTYPAVRIRILQQKPPMDVNCNWTDLQFAVQSYSESSSSEESEKMEAEVTNFLDKKTISYDGIKIYALHCAGMLEAQRIDERTWMAETLFTAKVSVA